MTCTAASQQGAIETFWLHFRAALGLSIFLYGLQFEMFMSLRVTNQLLARWCQLTVLTRNSISRAITGSVSSSDENNNRQKKIQASREKEVRERVFVVQL